MNRLEITTMLVKIDSIIESNNVAISMIEESIANARLRAKQYGTDETTNIFTFTSQVNEFIELNVCQNKLYRSLLLSLEMQTR